MSRTSEDEKKDRRGRREVQKTRERMVTQNHEWLYVRNKRRKRCRVPGGKFRVDKSPKRIVNLLDI